MMSLAEVADAPAIVNVVNEAIRKAQPFRKEQDRITQEEVEKTICHQTLKRWYLLKKVNAVISTLLFRKDGILEGSIHMFSTKTSEQGHGFGAKLLEHVETEERMLKLSLWCVEAPGLIRYYEKLGFQLTGDRKLYHPDYLKPEWVGKITIVKMKKEKKCSEKDIVI